jgi:hypothetical protein
MPGLIELSPLFANFEKLKESYGHFFSTLTNLYELRNAEMAKGLLMKEGKMILPNVAVGRFELEERIHPQR